MKRILVVDDEESICEILKFNLEREGYEVETANSAEEVLEMDLTGINLMIVDIMMERLSGFDLVKRLRYKPVEQHIPVIFCSALSDEDNTVMGLNIGADDYITKPFNIPELIARVKAVLRRTAPIQAEPLHQPAPAPRVSPNDIIFEGIRIDNNEKVCYIDGHPVKLTPNEYKLLHYLLTNRGRIHSRKEILLQLWDNSVTERTVDVTITRIKRKIGRYGDYIKARTGFGYGITEKI